MGYWFNSVDYLNKIKIKLNCYLLFDGCYGDLLLVVCGVLLLLGDLLMISGGVAGCDCCCFVFDDDDLV